MENLDTVIWRMALRFYPYSLLGNDLHRRLMALGWHSAAWARLRIGETTHDVDRFVSRLDLRPDKREPPPAEFYDARMSSTSLAEIAETVLTGAGHCIFYKKDYDFCRRWAHFVCNHLEAAVRANLGAESESLLESLRLAGEADLDQLWRTLDRRAMLEGPLWNADPPEWFARLWGQRLSEDWENLFGWFEARFFGIGHGLWFSSEGDVEFGLRPSGVFDTDDCSRIDRAVADIQRNDANRPSLNPHDVFLLNYDDLMDLIAQADAHKTSPLNRALLVQTFSATEAFLSDTLRNACRYKKIMRALVRNSSQLRRLKVDLLDVENMGTSSPVQFVQSQVDAYLSRQSFHNFETVDGLFVAAFGTGFLPGKEFRTSDHALLLGAVQVRHDCVHRNGLRTDGRPRLEVTQAYLERVTQLTLGVANRCKEVVDAASSRLEAEDSF